MSLEYHYNLPDGLSIKRGELVVRQSYVDDECVCDENGVTTNVVSHNVQITLMQGKSQQMLNDLIPNIKIQEVMNDWDGSSYDLNQGNRILGGCPQKSNLTPVTAIQFPRRGVGTSEGVTDFLPSLARDGEILRLLYAMGIARTLDDIQREIAEENKDPCQKSVNRWRMRTLKRVLQALERGKRKKYMSQDERDAYDMYHRYPRQGGAAFAKLTMESLYEAGIDAEPEMTTVEVESQLAKMVR